MHSLKQQTGRNLPGSPLRGSSPGSGFGASNDASSDTHLENNTLVAHLLFKEQSVCSLALEVIKNSWVVLFHIRARIPSFWFIQQFHFLKSFFEDVFVMFVHRPGKKYMRTCPECNVIGNLKGHDVIIPAELCRITSDQRYTQAPSGVFVLSMVKFSSKSPHDRLALISAGINGRSLPTSLR